MRGNKTITGKKERKDSQSYGRKTQKDWGVSGAPRGAQCCFSINYKVGDAGGGKRRPMGSFKVLFKVLDIIFSDR